MVDEHFEIALFTGNDKFNADLLGVFRHIAGHIRGSVLRQPAQLIGFFLPCFLDCLGRSIGLYALRLLFTTENSQEVDRVLRAWETAAPFAPGGCTRGLYLRGVE